VIEAGLEFRPSAIPQVVRAFLSLPGELRPTHESADEKEVGTEVRDSGKLLERVTKIKTGFFLKGPHVTCDISLAGSTPIICNCFLDVGPILAKRFLAHMATAQPVFGFACAPEERVWRNRVTTTQGVNSIEIWVGRDTMKYVPGLYWLTLLPEALAEMHHIPLSSVERIALEHIKIEGGQHLFRFYERPEDWRSAKGVTKLCSSLPGIFDIEKVRPRLVAAKNFLDLNAVASKWK